MRMGDEFLDFMVDAARKKATHLGIAVSIAIVDEGGNLLRFVRMKGSPLTSVGVSQDKAYTAAASGLATHTIFEIIKDDPMLLRGIPEYPRIIILGGGYPFHAGDAVSGGLGVSGGTVSQDMEVALAGISVL